MKKARIKTPLGIAELEGDADGLSSIKILDEGEPSKELPPELESCCRTTKGLF